MPSQPLSTFSTSLPSPVCLPLNKFSYATVSSEHIAPIPWIHLSSKNGLFTIFETSPTQLENGQLEDRPKLKVLKDPEVMEDIDLHLLSLEAHRSLEPAPKSPVDAQVTIMVKVPNIAIKYPMTNGQIRRFQMRFASNEHYYDAMKILCRANVPAVDASSLPQNKPRQPVQDFAPTNILPEDSASQIGGFNPMPQSYGTSANLGSDLNGRPHSMLISGATARNMPPPTLRPGSHFLGQPPTMKNPTKCPAENQSNVSMTTGTTLVPGMHLFQVPQPVATADHRAIAPHSDVNTIVQPPSDAGYEVHQQDNADLTRRSPGLLLPPKRELPFTKTKRAADVNFSEKATLTTTEVAGLVSKNSDGGAIESHTASARGQDEAAPTSKAKPKRASTKTGAKPPAAKKPRATTARKKPALKRAAKNETPVPSVEDLLKRPDLGRWTRSRSLLAAEHQSPKESSRRQEGIRVQETMVEKQPARTSPSGKRSNQCAPPEMEDTPIDQGHTFPCTPADQIIQTHTPRSPTGLFNAVSKRQLTDEQGEQTQKAPFDLFTTINSEARLQNPAPVAHAQRTVDTRRARESNFDDANTSLEAWAGLPLEVRNADLRDFVCQSIMQPGFIDLCKELEIMWETTLLEPRLRN